MNRNYLRFRIYSELNDVAEEISTEYDANEELFMGTELEMIHLFCFYHLLLNILFLLQQLLCLFLSADGSLELDYLPDSPKSPY